MKRYQKIYPKSRRYKTRTRIRGYIRKKKKEGTKLIIWPKPVKLYPIRNEQGSFMGWSKKPPKKRKRGHLLIGKQLVSLQQKLGDIELRRVRGELTSEEREKLRAQIVPEYKEKVKEYRRERARWL